MLLETELAAIGTNIKETLGQVPFLCNILQLFLWRPVIPTQTTLFELELHLPVMDYTSISFILHLYGPSRAHIVARTASNTIDGRLMKGRRRMFVHPTAHHAYRTNTHNLLTYSDTKTTDDAVKVFKIFLANKRTTNAHFRRQVPHNRIPRTFGQKQFEEHLAIVEHPWRVRLYLYSLFNGIKA